MVITPVEPFARDGATSSAMSANKAMRTTLMVASNAGLTQWRLYGEWAYECNSPPIRNDRKGITGHS